MMRTIKSAQGSVANGSDGAARKAVQSPLAQVEKGGDNAIRELLIRLDKFDRESDHLTKAEIDGCVNSLTKREREHLDLTQQRIHKFAEAQKATLRDLEVETLPGVVLGHRHVPIQNVGCYAMPIDPS
jgi:sulfopropanediol 3-dehydrogenase